MCVTIEACKGQSLQFAKLKPRLRRTPSPRRACCATRATTRARYSAVMHAAGHGRRTGCMAVLVNFRSRKDRTRRTPPLIQNYSKSELTFQHLCCQQNTRESSKKQHCRSWRHREVFLIHNQELKLSEVFCCRSIVYNEMVCYKFQCACVKLVCKEDMTSQSSLFFLELSALFTSLLRNDLKCLPTRKQISLSSQHDVDDDWNEWG